MNFVKRWHSCYSRSSACCIDSRRIYYSPENCLDSRSNAVRNSPQTLSFASEPQRILLVLPTWVGDLVMATPFIAAIFKRFAHAEISMLMHQHLVSLLEGSPWVGNYYFWPRRDGSKEARAAQRRLIKDLRLQRFDLAITLPNSFRSAWICWRAGAKRRVGFSRDGRGMLLTDRIQPPNKMTDKPKNTPAHMRVKKFKPMPLVEYYADLAQAIGCEHPGDALALFTTPANDLAVDQRLADAGVESTGLLVVLCPGANFGASKCWPPERFAAVADRLVRQHHATIVISPGPGEEPLAKAIHSTMQQSSVLLIEPCLTLGELKSLIQRSKLLLGNDTGPRHFARAFDVNRVTVFGPTEVVWTDTSHDRETIVRVDVPCGPCHLKVCPLQTRECMERVTVDMVANACTQALAPLTTD